MVLRNEEFNESTWLHHSRIFQQSEFRMRSGKLIPACRRQQQCSHDLTMNYLKSRTLEPERTIVNVFKRNCVYWFSTNSTLATWNWLCRIAFIKARNHHKLNAIRNRKRHATRWWHGSIFIRSLRHYQFNKWLSFWLLHIAFYVCSI